MRRILPVFLLFLKPWLFWLFTLLPVFELKPHRNSSIARAKGQVNQNRPTKQRNRNRKRPDQSHSAAHWKINQVKSAEKLLKALQGGRIHSSRHRQVLVMGGHFPTQISVRRYASFNAWQLWQTQRSPVYLSPSCWSPKIPPTKNWDFQLTPSAKGKTSGCQTVVPFLRLNYPEIQSSTGGTIALYVHLHNESHCKDCCLFSRHI